jgi:hypothetical protein
VGGLKVNEDAARDVLLLRAVESEDSSAVVLTRDDRQYSTAEALSWARLAEPARSRDKVLFLARRAEVALERLIPRYPTLSRVRKLARWPHWLSWGLPLAALVIGLATNAIDGQQLNILAFPLLGMLAWNFAVYLWLLIAKLRSAAGSSNRTAGHPVLSMFDWVVRPANARLASHPTLERAVSRFAREWSAVAAKLTRHRASCTLHFSAAMFAVGIVTGMLVRARYTAEYSAGWAGTWAGAETEIAAFLGILLAPASALTGIALPSVERLRALRGSGENAGDWLILWVVTAALFVILPRLGLALYNGLRAAVLKRRLPIEEDFYVRSLLRDALGQARSVWVVPYGFELSTGARERLGRLLSRAIGEKAQVRCDPSIAYGEEDEWLVRKGDDLTAADQVILLFNLASTPEAENHGTFATGVRQRVGAHSDLTVLLDDSAFRYKFRGQPSAERRIEERLQAWKAVLAATRMEPIRVSLDSAEEAAEASALEQAMLQAPALS